MASEGFREVESVLRCRGGGFEEEQEEEERLEREGGEGALYVFSVKDFISSHLISSTQEKDYHWG